MGVLRQDEARHTKLWRKLDIDPERKLLPLKEHRGRYSGNTPVTNTVREATIIQEPPKPKTVGDGIDRSSKFYAKARSGFPYWQGTNDIYVPRNPVGTRYEFGMRFNPGRLGVKCDRAYSAGGTNYHYWSSVESKMTPIGSGKALAETRRHY